MFGIPAAWSAWHTREGYRHRARLQEQVRELEAGDTP
jgi:hypothetical protein